jgi:hypothetical protein
LTMTDDTKLPSRRCGCWLGSEAGGTPPPDPSSWASLGFTEV